MGACVGDAMSYLRIMNEIRLERERQEGLKRDGKFRLTCADAEMGDGQFLSVLMEEVGEIAKAFNEADEENALTEMVQVAAVCVARLERAYRQ